MSVRSHRFLDPISGRDLSPFGGRLGPVKEHVLGLCPPATPGTATGPWAREKETRR